MLILVVTDIGRDFNPRHRVFAVSVESFNVMEDHIIIILSISMKLLDGVAGLR